MDDKCCFSKILRRFRGYIRFQKGSAPKILHSIRRDFIWQKKGSSNIRWGIKGKKHTLLKKIDQN